MPRGQLLWEEESRAVGRRIKDVSENGVSEEVQFVGQIKGFGRMEGTEARIAGTDDYWMKPSGGIITGSASGVMTFQDGEIATFKAIGLGKSIKQSPLLTEQLVSLIYFVDPHPNHSWMRDNFILWEAETDPKSQTIKAWAYEWEYAPEGGVAESTT
jgi:hypothetical protein